ncbi:MAG: PIN domain-containing protein [Treponema sp.]|jgi:predicted nucleic acid-binding protein|nr:PIN domain-containing protein [Treponema sp.]
MSEKVFIDTNILIYLYSEDEAEKQDISKKVFDKYACVISTQVLNEFCNVCIGKLNQSVEDVESAIDEIIKQCTVSLLEKHNIKQALQIHKRYGYKYFDSLIIASAISSDCKYLITEDLADGQILDDKLKIINIYSEDNVKKYLVS